MFRDYRQAYDEMEASQEIQITRQVIISTKERLAELEKPYRDRMAQARKRSPRPCYSLKRRPLCSESSPSSSSRAAAQPGRALLRPWTRLRT